MLKQITWPQFLELKAYDQIEPIGTRRTDYQAASICATLANLAVGRRSRRRFKVSDFLLEFDKQAEAAPDKPAGQTWQEQKMIAKMFFALSKVPTGPSRSRGKRRG